jgi:hypothetical protein
VHDLNTCNAYRHQQKRLESLHRSYHLLDRSVILFNDVVKIFDLADLDSRIMVGVVAHDRRRVSAALQSRFAVSRKSTVAPVLSTARYKYLQVLLIFT